MNKYLGVSKFLETKWTLFCPSIIECCKQILQRYGWELSTRRRSFDSSFQDTLCARQGDAKRFSEITFWKTVTFVKVETLSFYVKMTVVNTICAIFRFILFGLLLSPERFWQHPSRSYMLLFCSWLELLLYFEYVAEPSTSGK